MNSKNGFIISLKTFCEQKKGPIIFNIYIKPAKLIKENKTNYIYLSLQTDDETNKNSNILNLSSHINIQDNINQHFLFNSKDIMENTSLKGENFIYFIPYLKDITFKINKDHIKSSFLINNTCESIQSNNYIGDDKTEISFENVKFSMVETVAEHIKWSTRFIKNLPGFNQLNDHDLIIIIQKSMINLFSLQLIRIDYRV